MWLDGHHASVWISSGSCGRSLGFNEPEPGGRHFYARYAEHTLTIPNNSELSIPQLKMLLRQVEKILERKISLGEWQKL